MHALEIAIEKERTLPPPKLMFHLFKCTILCPSVKVYSVPLFFYQHATLDNDALFLILIF